MPKSLPDWKVQKIAELYTLGFTQKEIAKEVGTYRETVGEVLKSLERRPTKFTTLMVQADTLGTDWEGRDVDWIEETLNNFRENIEIEEPEPNLQCPKCQKVFSLRTLSAAYRTCPKCGITAIKIEE